MKKNISVPMRPDHVPPLSGDLKLAINLGVSTGRLSTLAAWYLSGYALNVIKEAGTFY